MARTPWKMRLAAWCAAWCFRLLAKTLRIEERWLDPQRDGRREGHGGALYLCWHDAMLIPAYLMGPCRPTVLVSQSDDGEFAARLAIHLGWRVVRGSSNRGAVRALRALVEEGARGLATMALTVDGPRGPRHVCKSGAVYLAAKTGLPLTPAAVGFANCWRLRSWDRFAIPKPFSRVVMVVGEGIVVPTEISSLQLDGYRQQAQAAMERLEHEAQRLASGQTLVNEADWADVRAA